jgi:hypothetical protein
MITEHNQPPDTKPTKVRVLEPFRVVHDATEYFGGDAVTVPEHIAQEWERSHWVERVTKG